MSLSDNTLFPMTQPGNVLCFLVAITMFAGGTYLLSPKTTGLNRTTVQPCQIHPRETEADACTDSTTSSNEPLVICYHQVRDWRSTDSRNARTYIIPVAAFREQMKLLHDNGYRTVLPDQWRGHPGVDHSQKSLILTFDDGTEGQYVNALPELNRYGFKAAFFIMTVTLGKPDFMSREQIRLLSENGHLIGCHTWDHHDVRVYGETDWITQLQRPTLLLEQITGKPIRYFAYPFGSWDAFAISRLKSQGYAAAFQLDGRADKDNPRFTIRRMIVDGHWPPSRFLADLNSFATRHSLRP